MPMKTRLVRGSPPVQGPAHRHDLPDDFARGQVAHQAPPGGQAEAAPLGAAHLGGQAQGVVAFFRNEDRLHQVAVGQGEEEFPAAIGSLLLLLHPELPDDGPKDQLLPEGPGDVGHLLKIADSLIEPLEHLPAAKGGLAPGGHELLHFGQGKFLQIDAVGHLR